MIQVGTKLKIADNTGAKLVSCIKVLGGSRRRYARIGDIIVASVKFAEPRKIVKKKEVVRVVIIRQKSPYRLKNGFYLRFDENAGVILDDKTKLPKGNRILGPVPRILREKNFKEIVAIAKELV